MNKLLTIFCCSLLFYFSCNSQDSLVTVSFTKQDTLRGSITPERAWWDVIKYDITVEPHYKTKTITGNNIISFKATEDGKLMQVDLQQPMNITAVTHNNNNLPFTRNGNAYYIQWKEPIRKGTSLSIKINFEGQPHESVNPPWDGGWIWRRDSDGNPWITVACQGMGASVWYPCKDHQSDEPDSAKLSIIVPDTLVGVGNGRLQSITPSPGKRTYTWVVVNPINSYNIVPYIGKYDTIADTYQGKKGELKLDYRILPANVQKARAQFSQVPKMLKCFEYWFGPYPFYEDGYKIVESPHLGMEHQSAIAYGNKFTNGYLGKDLSGTGWGKKWDFIIIHESGHEWFANNITTKDVADMWVHEGFTNYSEVLFTECEYGKEAGSDYCTGLRKNILNDKPVIGPYGVNKEGSNDMYFKGSNLIHTIRQIIDDDEKFRSILRGLNKDFYHQTVTGNDVENYISEKSGKDLSKVFDQYLRTVRIPVFEYTFQQGSLKYRWNNCVPGFNMPLKIITDKHTWIYPSEEWKTISLNGETLKVDRNFYVRSRKM